MDVWKLFGKNSYGSTPFTNFTSLLLKSESESAEAGLTKCVPAIDSWAKIPIMSVSSKYAGLKCHWPTVSKSNTKRFSKAAQVIVAAATWATNNRI